jgi:hypothetical protein
VVHTIPYTVYGRISTALYRYGTHCHPYCKVEWKPSIRYGTHIKMAVYGCMGPIQYTDSYNTRHVSVQNQIRSVRDEPLRVWRRVVFHSTLDPHLRLSVRRRSVTARIRCLTNNCCCCHHECGAGSWKLSVNGCTRTSTTRLPAVIVIEPISEADIIEGFPVALRRWWACR